MTNDLEEAPAVAGHASRGCKHSNRTCKRTKEICELPQVSSCV